MQKQRRAIVIGSGPNGLSAAIVLAQAGITVDVYEAEAIPGGACRTLELTLPGFLHDFGSAVHPMGAGSPFFQSRCRSKSTGSNGSIHPHRWPTHFLTALLPHSSAASTNNPLHSAKTAPRGTDCSRLSQPTGMTSAMPSCAHSRPSLGPSGSIRCS